MSKVTVEEAINNFKNLLKRVAAREEIIIVEQNQAVAHLSPASTEENIFADMRQFR